MSRVSWIKDKFQIVGAVVGVGFVISLGHNDRDQNLIVFVVKFPSPRLKTCVDVGKTVSLYREL